MRYILLIVALFFLSPSPPAQAQAFPTCYDARGLPVTYMPNVNVNDIAIASLTPNGLPIVSWNPNVTNSSPPEVVEFFYYHECAHHALGQLLNNPMPVPGSERDADCWAKRTMYGLGILPPQKYQVIVNGLLQASKPNIDWPNGGLRVQYLNSC